MSAINVRPMRPKIVHMAGKIRGDGAVSAMCSDKPRAINLRVATWTNRREAVTCEKCKAMFDPRYLANAPVVTS